MFTYRAEGSSASVNLHPFRRHNMAATLIGLIYFFNKHLTFLTDGTSLTKPRFGALFIKSHPSPTF